MLQEDEEERLQWCKIMSLARHIIAVLYMNTFLFSLIFRVVLIRFADRGLVVKGKPDLVLFHQLYWLVFVAFFVVGIFMFPFSTFVLDTYTSSAEGRVCMLQPLETSTEIVRRRLMVVSYVGIIAVFNKYLSFKVKLFLHGICPNDTMYCIGNYKRNMLSFKTNSKLINLWAIYALLETVIFMTPMLYNNKWLTPEVIFCSHNIMCFMLIEIVHGIILPMKIVIPWKEKETARPDFYVNKPDILEPRRTSLPSFLPSPAPRPKFPPLSPLQPVFPQLYQPSHRLALDDRLTIWREEIQLAGVEVVAERTLYRRREGCVGGNRSEMTSGTTHFM